MKKLFIISLLLINISFIYADFSFQSILDDYYRFEEISGLKPYTLSNFTTEELVTEEFNYWDSFSFNKNILENKDYAIYITMPQFFMSYNHDYAYGGSDRVAFQGKGFNLSMITGIKYISETISIKLNPEIFLSQNSDFDIVETTYSSGYGDYWTIFDNLQRYGDDPFYLLSLGQSVIRVNLFNLSLGIGTENITTSFNKKNSFLLSDNANGFPHIDFGTDEDISIKYLGDIEAKMMWGVISESEYFDEDDSNDDAWISGMFVGYTPSFMPNLKLGANHLYTTPLSGWDIGDMVNGIPGVDWANTPAAEDDNDMMVSLSFRWIFPESNFEVYGEWARNDNFTNFLQLYGFPELSAGFTLGFSSILGHIINNYPIQLSCEYTNSTRSESDLSPPGPWYRHAFGGWTQGYTNGGQILGLDIGPGAESLWLELKLITEKSSYALSVERQVYDKDYYYEYLESEGLALPMYFNIGIDGFHKLDDFAIYWEILDTLNYNRNYISMNHSNNVHVELGISLTY